MGTHTHTHTRVHRENAKHEQLFGVGYRHESAEKYACIKYMVVATHRQRRVHGGDSGGIPFQQLLRVVARTKLNWTHGQRLVRFET